jgi:hypothetical protein
MTRYRKKPVDLDDQAAEVYEDSINLTPGVVWTDAQVAVVRQLAARAFRAEQRAETAEHALASLRARVQALADALTTRYPEAGPHTQRLLAAIATDIRATITDTLRGDQ